MQSFKFPCSSCGECCKNIRLSEQTTYLDRGDGTCRNFDDTTKLCLIYDQRPLVCRVEEYYNHYLKDDYEWQEFVDMNLKICKTLQENSVSPVKFYK